MHKRVDSPVADALPRTQRAGCRAANCSPPRHEPLQIRY